MNIKLNSGEYVDTETCLVQKGKKLQHKLVASITHQGYLPTLDKNKTEEERYH